MVKFNRRIFIAGLAAVLPACQRASNSETVQSSKAELPIFDVYSDKMKDLVHLDTPYDVLGQGYGWSEGPTWDRKRQQLYFTDVPGNTAHVWKEGQGVNVFLQPSGGPATAGIRSAGANGLLYVNDDSLLLCNHGSRTLEKIDLESGTRTTLTSDFMGKRYNSPNDVVRHSNGDIYFTDPPYGLEGLDSSPIKELKENGVYKLDTSGKVERLMDDLIRPNGVVLSPDERYLYVAQSDSAAMHLYRLDLQSLSAPAVRLTDFSSYADENSPGLPDGMAVDTEGNIFATGPGGVFIISPNGDVLGRIKTGKASANCCFGEDGKTLFITNHDRLLRLRVKAKGLEWA